MRRMTRRVYVCTAAALWAWLAAMAVASAGGRGPGAELSGGAVLGARCAARCLGLHVTSPEGRGQVGRAVRRITRAMANPEVSLK